VYVCVVNVTSHSIPGGILLGTMNVDKCLWVDITSLSSYANA